MFTEKDLIGLYFRYDKYECYKITNIVNNKVEFRCLKLYYKNFEAKYHLSSFDVDEVLNYLIKNIWEFIFHDNIISKNSIMQELIESKDKDNINIAIEMYKTLKNEEETTITNTDDYSHR